MPYPNEHSCRVQSPEQYTNFARKVGEGKQPDIILGIKGGKSEAQAFRYPITKFSEAEAKASCEEKGGTFEPATKEQIERITNAREMVSPAFSYEHRESEGEGKIYKDVLLMAEGTWKDASSNQMVHYPASTLKQYATNWKANPLLTVHTSQSRDVRNIIGEVRNPHYGENKRGKGVLGDVFLHGLTQASKETISLIDTGIVKGVSVEVATEDSYNPDTRELTAVKTEFHGAAVVQSGACKACTFHSDENGIIELNGLYYHEASGTWAYSKEDILKNINKKEDVQSMIEKEISDNISEDECKALAGSWERIDVTKLPASAFLYVPDPEKKSTWKLPYKNPDGSINCNAVRAIQAAIAGARTGKPMDVPQTVKDEASKLMEDCQKREEAGKGVNMAEGKKAEELTVTELVEMNPCVKQLHEANEANKAKLLDAEKALDEIRKLSNERDAKIKELTESNDKIKKELEDVSSEKVQRTQITEVKAPTESSYDNIRIHKGQVGRV